MSSKKRVPRHNRTDTHNLGLGRGGEEKYKENILSENKF